MKLPKKRTVWTCVAVFLALAVGFLIFQWNVDHFHLLYWLQFHTGTINEAGPYYGFFSGFGSDLGEYVIATSVLGGLYHAVKKNNCHTHGCLRIGSYPTKDGYKVCKPCHFEIEGTHPTIEHLKVRHQFHLAKEAREGQPHG
jgi:hypothetical protein